MESGSAPCVVPLADGTLASRVDGVGTPGIVNLAFWGKGVLVVVRAEGNGVEAGVVGQRSGRGGRFFGQGGVGSAMGGMRVFGPTS